MPGPEADDLPPDVPSASRGDSHDAPFDRPAELTPADYAAAEADAQRDATAQAAPVVASSTTFDPHAWHGPATWPDAHEVAPTPPPDAVQPWAPDADETTVTAIPAIAAAPAPIAAPALPASPAAAPLPAAEPVPAAVISPASPHGVRARWLLIPLVIALIAAALVVGSALRPQTAAGPSGSGAAALPPGQSTGSGGGATPGPGGPGAAPGSGEPTTPGEPGPTGTAAQGDTEPGSSPTPDAPTPTPVPTSLSPEELTGYSWPVYDARITTWFAPTLAGFIVIDGERIHDGLDMATVCGDTVRAAHDGTVLYAGRKFDPFIGYEEYPTAFYDRIGHNLSSLPVVIVIDDGNGYRSIYVHVRAKVRVSAGDTVHAGDPIGWESDTGHATGCHLHYSLVRMDGPYVPVASDLVNRYHYPGRLRERIDPVRVLSFLAPHAAHRDRRYPPPSVSPGYGPLPGLNEAALPTDPPPGG